MTFSTGSASGGGEYFVVRTSVVPEVVTEVRVYTETFSHVREEHGAQIGAILDMPIMSGAIASAIASPSRVETGRPGSVKFIDAKSVNSAGDPLVVLVKAVEGTSCRMQTLYFGETSAGSKVIWGER